MPIRLWVEASLSCNLQCAMCPNKDIPASEKGIMSFSLFKKIIDEAKDFVSDIFIHHRGESLLNPNLFEAYYFYASTCFLDGKFDKAIDLYKEAGRVNPADYQAPAYLAFIYQMTGQQDKMTPVLDEALHKIEQRLALNPDDSRAIYLGAGVHARMGDQVKAMEWIKRLAATTASAGVRAADLVQEESVEPVNGQSMVKDAVLGKRRDNQDSRFFPRLSGPLPLVGMGCVRAERMWLDAALPEPEHEVQRVIFPTHHANVGLG